MELANFNSIATTLVCMAILSLVWKAVNRAWWRPKKLEKYLKQQGLQGTSYKVLIGDSKHLFAMRKEQDQTTKPSSFSHDYFPRIFPFIHETMVNHGKISYMWLGPYPIINITKLELVKEVLSNIYCFQKLKLGSKLLTPGLLSEEGEVWTQHRKMLTLPFRISKLKVLMPTFSRICNEMLNKWEESIDKTAGSCELDVFPYLENLMEEAVSKATFGDTCESGRTIFKLLKEQTSLIGVMRKSTYFPGSRFLPTKANRRLKEIHEEVKKSLGSLISARKKEILLEASQGITSTKSDMLSSVMESTSDEKQLIEDCKLFYLAANDSTVRLLVWTIILLSKHQDWQTKAREEVLMTFGHNQPDFDGLSNLKIVTMIINEVLRLYPPVPMLVRSVTKDTKLGNLSLPAGSLVSLPLLVVQRDPELWGEDANEFNPERFSQGISKAALLAFSAGPRICLGLNLAMIEAKMAIAMVLQRFSLSASPSYVHAPYFSLILEPQYGAPVILHRL